MKTTNLPKNPLVNYYIGLVITYIIWAAAGPVIKLTLEYVPPYTFLFLRFLLVCILVLPHVIYNLKHESVNPKDYIKIFILGVFAQTSLIFIFLGYKYTSSLEATIISVLGPLLSIWAGNFFYREKIESRVKIGLAIATMGTVFVALEPIFTEAKLTVEVEKRLFGNFMVILNNLAFILYIIWSKISMGQSSGIIKKSLHYIHMKPMTKSYSPILLTSLSFYIGLVTFIPFMLMELAGKFGPVDFSIINLPVIPIVGILFMAIFSSIVAYYLFEWCLIKVPIKETAVFSYLQPVFTLPFAYWLLSELPNANMLIGCMIIAFGVMIAEIKKS